MTDNGIAATGDISNNTSTVNTKRNSNIFYHSFIEVYDLFSRNIDNIIDHAKSVMKEFMDLPAGSCSITPHSPYTVSGDLFDTVGKIALNNNGIISVHNQESEAEDELFQKKDGRLFRKLQCLGTDLSRFKATGRSSLQSFLKKLPSSVNILLVHNTFTKEEDIDFTSEYSDNIYWVLCPGSNLFIGNRLPDVELFSKKNLKVALGTDSYASNRRLSVLEEMKTISGHYPSIPFADLIKWGTLNGAEALNISRKYGSLEPGKAPGINLIENFDLGTMSLKENSSVRVLVKPISDLNNENF
jgi:cytosine/adenosine deaminase-related metal-dependent hydrolase